MSSSRTDVVTQSVCLFVHQPQKGRQTQKWRQPQKWRQRPHNKDDLKNEAELYMKTTWLRRLYQAHAYTTLGVLVSSPKEFLKVFQGSLKGVYIII